MAGADRGFFVSGLDFGTTDGVYIWFL